MVIIEELTCWLSRYFKYKLVIQVVLKSNELGNKEYEHILAKCIFIIPVLAVWEVSKKSNSIQHNRNGGTRILISQGARGPQTCLKRNNHNNNVISYDAPFTDTLY